MSRWSVPLQPGLPAGTASTAGLAGLQREAVGVAAQVGDEHRLRLRVLLRNCGSVSTVACRSGGHPVPSAMLWPSEETFALPQFDAVAPPPTVLVARIEFSSEIVPAVASTPPPLVPAVPPSLPKIVELTIVVVLVHGPAQSLSTPPPPAAGGVVVDRRVVDREVGAREPEREVLDASTNPLDVPLTWLTLELSWTSECDRQAPRRPGWRSHRRLRPWTGRVGSDLR